MIRYIHGSEDSNDIDVFYVFEKMPSFRDAQLFCSEKGIENRNIIVIENGLVIDCFKGTCDEIQNSLIATYGLHKQEYPLLLQNTVKRNIPLKAVRVLRCFLSHYSRTSARPVIKSALQSGSWFQRLECVSNLDLDETEYGKNSVIEVRKVFAFQLAQILGLFEDREIYTKSEAALLYPGLRTYLYRESGNDGYILSKYFDDFIETCACFDIEEGKDGITYFRNFNVKIDIKNEIVI